MGLVKHIYNKISKSDGVHFAGWLNLQTQSVENICVVKESLCRQDRKHSATKNQAWQVNRFLFYLGARVWAELTVSVRPFTEKCSAMQASWNL